MTTDTPRLASLDDRRPDMVDKLEEVEGGDPMMERILNENGCYPFKLLANVSRHGIRACQVRTPCVTQDDQCHDVGAGRAFEHPGRVC